MRRYKKNQTLKVDLSTLFTHDDMLEVKEQCQIPSFISKIPKELWMGEGFVFELLSN